MRKSANQKAEKMGIKSMIIETICLVFVIWLVAFLIIVFAVRMPISVTLKGTYTFESTDHYYTIQGKVRKDYYVTMKTKDEKYKYENRIDTLTYDNIKYGGEKLTTNLQVFQSNLSSKYYVVKYKTVEELQAVYKDRAMVIVKIAAALSGFILLIEIVGGNNSNRRS